MLGEGVFTYLEDVLRLMHTFMGGILSNKHANNRRLHHSHRQTTNMDAQMSVEFANAITSIVNLVELDNEAARSVFAYIAAEEKNALFVAYKTPTKATFPDTAVGITPAFPTEHKLKQPGWPRIIGRRADARYLYELMPQCSLRQHGRAGRSLHGCSHGCPDPGHKHLRHDHSYQQHRRPCRPDTSLSHLPQTR